MKYYKLTDSEGFTKHKTHWEPGKTVRAQGKGVELCTDGVLHYYDSPYLAMLMNPIHAGIENPRMFEVEGDQVATDGAKSGAKELKVIREVDPPRVTTEIGVRFAILAALEVYDASDFNRWARDWLAGKDRSERAAARAEAAARAARAAARAAAEAAEWGAAEAERAARSAAVAADSATKAVGKRVNLSEIAEKAFQLGHPGKDASHES